MTTLKKKDIKALFRAIRKHDNEEAKRLLTKHSLLINCCATAPPKKDDGQSPLQVALKTGNGVMANLLIDLGADVHFQESSGINSWTAPAFHDGLRFAAFTARSINRDDASHHQEAKKLIERMLGLGVNPNVEDSIGNNAFMRWGLDCYQVLSSMAGFPAAIEDRSICELLRAISCLLHAAQADPDKENHSGVSLRLYAESPAVAYALGLR